MGRIQDNGSAQEVVKICYTEETRNLNFRITTASLDDLKECVKIIKSYNEFDYVIINEALDKFASYPKYYNEGNPNNGYDSLEFEIGREGSPVMYITYRNIFYDKYTDKDGEIRTLTQEQFKENMKTLSKLALADECDFTDTYGGVECRLWWD